MVEITALRTNHIDKPLGFLLPYVRLTWQIQSEELVETVSVQVALDEEFTNILYHLDELHHTNECVLPIELSPRTRYFWKVTVNHLYESSTEWFETGKLSEPWSATWIQPPKTIQADPYIRTVFEVNKDVTRARLYACGLGVYEAEMNGTRIGDEYLAPGFHAYDFWQQYQTYDVSSYVQKGKNAIGFLLGDGWFKGRIGFDGGYEELYGDQLQLIAEIHIDYADGTHECIQTDATWEWIESPVLFSAIYDGEKQDARKQIADWSLPTCESQQWTKVACSSQTTDELTERLSLPVKNMQTLTPTLLMTPAGETVLDFGQNMTGWIEFDIEVEAGQTVKYQVGEILQEGNFYRDNLRTAVASFEFTSNGERQHVRPHSTFYGFRYAKLTGFPDTIQPEDFTGVVLYSEMEETGQIHTANPLVNQLVQNTKWGQKGNFLDVPTDCPQRDERLGWTGDAQIFARTASYHMFTPAFYTKFMKDVRLEQQALNGSVPFTVPMLKPPHDPGFVTGNGAAAWSDVATILPWVLYEQYADTSLLAQHYPIMKDWVDFVFREDQEAGSRRLWSTRFQFGDWLALDGPDPSSPMGGTETMLVASVYYYYGALLVSKAAIVLGKEDDAIQYKQLSDDIRLAIQREYITESGKVAVRTQTAYAMLLYFDLVPDGVKKRVIQDFKDKLIGDGVRLQTGFVGTAYLLEALSKSGLHELAYSLLLNEEYPGWLYAVKMGATTVWERWNSVMPDGSMNPQGMNSLNHYAYGVIAEWMYRYVLGIQADENHPGFKHFYLKPQPSIQLKEAEGTYHSISGIIQSGWKLQKDRIQFEFSIPFGTSATVTFPRATCELLPFSHAKQEGENVVVVLSAGKYQVSYTPTTSYHVSFSTEQTLEELLEYTVSRSIIMKNPAMYNDMVLGYRKVPFKQFSSLPIVSTHFVTKEFVDAVEEQFSKLNETN